MGNWQVWSEGYTFTNVVPCIPVTSGAASFEMVRIKPSLILADLSRRFTW